MDDIVAIVGETDKKVYYELESQPHVNWSSLDFLRIALPSTYPDVVDFEYGEDSRHFSVLFVSPVAKERSMVHTDHLIRGTLNAGLAHAAA